MKPKIILKFFILSIFCIEYNEIIESTVEIKYTDIVFLENL